eukprot:Skav209504  [mRNA]  locus=scaffold2767:92465:102649:+ [translate_table: standard]
MTAQTLNPHKVHNNLVLFDGASNPHWTNEFEGTRYAVILYSMGKSYEETPGLPRGFLSQLGYRVPPAEFNEEVLATKACSGQEVPSLEGTCHRGPNEKLKLRDLVALLAPGSCAVVSRGRPNKFAVKGDAFVDNVKCSMKIRVYSTEQRYAVEFQKRGGDSVAFNQAFRQAVKFLSSHFTMDSSTKEIPSPCDSPMSSEADFPSARMDELITPVLHMAGAEQTPWIQAEAATSLADISKDRSRATAQLFYEKAFKEIQNLLQSDDADIAYPISRLVSNLAQMTQAGEMSPLAGLLPIMIEKAFELAQAIHLVIQNGCDDQERVTRQLRIATENMSDYHPARSLLEKAKQRGRFDTEMWGISLSLQTHFCGFDWT